MGTVRLCPAESAAPEPHRSHHGGFPPPHAGPPSNNPAAPAGGARGEARVDGAGRAGAVRRGRRGRRGGAGRRPRQPGAAAVRGAWGGQRVGFMWGGAGERRGAASRARSAGTDRQRAFGFEDHVVQRSATRPRRGLRAARVAGAPGRKALLVRTRAKLACKRHPPPRRRQGLCGAPGAAGHVPPRRRHARGAGGRAAGEPGPPLASAAARSPVRGGGSRGRRTPAAGAAAWVLEAGSGA
jgi:hypothetical protein